MEWFGVLSCDYMLHITLKEKNNNLSVLHIQPHSFTDPVVPPHQDKVVTWGDLSLKKRVFSASAAPGFLLTTVTGDSLPNQSVCD